MNNRQHAGIFWGYVDASDLLQNVPKPRWVDIYKTETQRSKWRNTPV